MKFKIEAKRRTKIFHFLCICIGRIMTLEIFYEKYFLMQRLTLSEYV